MNKLVPILLLPLLVGAQSTVQPYDWSGHLGAVTDHGWLQWNQDWQSGTLLFDGTISTFPVRFGSGYKQYGLSESNPDLASGHPENDSTYTATSLKYSRGDYFYDAMEIQADFHGQRRQIGLQGFKRTYAGPYGQYIPAGGIVQPIQQSYRLDYGSSKNETVFHVSAGKFITSSGLYFPGGVGIFKDDLTLAGFDVRSNFMGAAVSGHHSITNRRFRIQSGLLPITGTRFLTRRQSEIILGLKQNLAVNFSRDSRILSADSLDLYDEIWYQLSGTMTWSPFSIQLGGVLDKATGIRPIGVAHFNLVRSAWTLDGVMQSLVRPQPALLAGNNGWPMVRETWLQPSVTYRRGAAQVHGFISQIFLNDYHDGTVLMDTSVTPSIQRSGLTIGSQGSLIWKRIQVELAWRHAFAGGSFTQGYRDHIKIQTKGNFHLFNRHLLTELKTEVEGVLGRDSAWRYDPYTGIPYESATPGPSPQNYWIANISIKADVSTFTLIWSIKNLGGVLRGSGLNWIPEAYSQMRPNLDLPPIGRMVQFTVVWNFIDR